MKFRTLAYACLLLPLILALTACHDHPSAVATVDMPVSISIPSQSATRTPGDPGLNEGFELPSRAWVFVVFTTDQGSSWRMNSATVDLRPDQWSQTGSICTYSRITLPIPENCSTVRVYAVLSADNALDLSRPVAEIANENDLQQLAFDIPADYDPDRRSRLIKNLYSSPCDLMNGKGEYYGTFHDINATNSEVALICYHVAAKLDVTWTVSEPERPSKKLSYLKAHGFRRTGCSLFRPANRESSATADRYDEILTEAYDYDSYAGTQWYGRKSVYVPYEADRTRLEFTLGFNGTHDPAQKAWATLGNYNDDPYTPWLRGFLNI